MKLGYINAEQVFHESPQRMAMMQEMQEKFKEERDELRGMQSEAKVMVEKLNRDGAQMELHEVEKLRNDISQLDSEYKIKGQALENELEKFEAAETERIMQLIQASAKEVAEQEGYDMVVDIQAIHYAKPECDISEMVIEALK